VNLSWVFVAVIWVVLVGTAILLSGFVQAEPRCFDTEHVNRATRLLGTVLRWEGVDEANKSTARLYLDPDGERWAIWSFTGDEGCLVAKGTDWRRQGRAALR
jgi:hypothetical protein